MRENAHLSLSPINRRPHIAQKKKPPQVSPRRLSPQRLFVGVGVGIGIGIDRLVMLMTGQTTIQEVLLFPQMRPEKTVKKDTADKYVALGIDEAWVPALHKAGYLTTDTLVDANPNKLRQELCEMNKKYKLELQNPTAEEVEAWIAGAAK